MKNYNVAELRTNIYVCKNVVKQESIRATENIPRNIPFSDWWKILRPCKREVYFHLSIK